EVTMEEIKTAMTKLPDKYRNVLQLYLLEGYDHEEIGKILELSNTASRTRLLRGKGFLRAILTQEHHETGS
ncbi:MAG: sigma-70 family RNA polymerase sigma factor, partial [Eudoraea sp.]|nr:sigma-70 family RNA polymerase sigma factor [Eudoraea sp.]